MDTKMPKDPDIRIMIENMKKQRGADSEAEQKRKDFLNSNIKSVCDYAGVDIPQELTQEVSYYIFRNEPVFSFPAASKVIYHHFLNENTLTFCLPDTTPKMYVMNGSASEMEKRDAELAVSGAIQEVRKRWVGLPTTTLQVNEATNWLAKVSPQIDFEAFHEKPAAMSYVWFKNGVVDFAVENGKFIPLASLSREDIQTIYTPPFIIPHNYNPDWKPNPESKLEKFIEQVIPDVDKRSRLLQAVAASLIPSLKTRTAFMVGTGANGKSIMLEILRKFYGENNVSSTSFTDLSANKFSSFELVGKCANLVSEDPSDKVANTSTFRLLATQETLQVEQKFKNRFQFRPYVKNFFAMNVLPTVEDITDAFLRRIVIIPFPFQFVSEGWDGKTTFQADPKLLESFTEEEYEYLGGMLIDILRFIAYNPPVSPSQAEMEKIYEEYSMYSNTALMFVTTALEGQDEMAGEKIAQSDLYDYYRTFCRANAITCMGRNKFLKEAKDHLDFKRTHGVNWVVNIKLKDEYKRYAKK